MRKRYIGTFVDDSLKIKAIPESDPGVEHSVMDHSVFGSERSQSGRWRFDSSTPDLVLFSDEPTDDQKVEVAAELKKRGFHVKRFRQWAFSDSPNFNKLLPFKEALNSKMSTKLIRIPASVPTSIIEAAIKKSKPHPKRPIVKIKTVTPKTAPNPGHKLSKKTDLKGFITAVYVAKDGEEAPSRFNSVRKLLRVANIDTHGGAGHGAYGTEMVLAKASQKEVKDALKDAPFFSELKITKSSLKEGVDLDWASTDDQRQDYSEGTEAEKLRFIVDVAKREGRAVKTEVFNDRIRVTFPGGAGGDHEDDRVLASKFAGKIGAGRILDKKEDGTFSIDIPLSAGIDEAAKNYSMSTKLVRIPASVPASIIEAAIKKHLTERFGGPEDVALYRKFMSDKPSDEAKAILIGAVKKFTLTNQIAHRHVTEILKDLENASRAKISAILGNEFDEEDQEKIYKEVDKHTNSKDLSSEFASWLA